MFSDSFNWDLYTGRGFHFLEQPSFLLFLPFASPSPFSLHLTPCG